MVGRLGSRMLLVLCVIICLVTGAEALSGASRASMAIDSMAIDSVAIEAADRAQLRAIIAQSRTDNQASADILDDLPAGDARLVRDQLTILRASASALSAELSNTPGTPSGRLANRIIRLGEQASSLRLGALADLNALTVLTEVRGLALEGLRRGLSGGFPASFDADQYRWSAAGAHALADVTAARAAIRSLTPLKATPSARSALEEARAGRMPRPLAGWAPIPGGCALPPASESEYLPAAGAPSPRLWTSPEGLADHRLQLASPTPALSAAYAKTIRQAKAMALQAGRPGSVSEVTKRVLSIGYAWLVTSEATYRDALVADARMLADATVREPVDEAKEAMLLGTIVDWLGVKGGVGPADDGGDVVTAARQVLKVRTMGSIGCSLALGENIAVDKLNKSVIIGSAIVMSALSLSDEGTWRRGLAATVQAGLAGAKSGLDVLDADGGSPEGPVYWNFQTVPAAGMLSSIDASLPDATVSRVPTLARAGRFALQMAAPSRTGDLETTRYSDTRDTVLRCTLPAWIAGRFADRDAIAVALRGQLRQGVELLWWPREEVDAPLTDAAFPSSGVAVLRVGEATAWLLGQPEITNHTQLDAGGVTVRVDGTDWSLDAGYGIEGPGYSEEKPNGRRWTYPQTQPAWHSTVRTLRSGSDLGQVVGATAKVGLRAGSAYVDLTSVLAGATQAERRISLSGSELTVVDVIKGARQAYAWSWVTEATVRVQGQNVVLVSDGRTATLSFEGLPAGSRITTDKVPAALGMPGTRIQVQLPASEQVSITARLAWSS